MRFTNPDALLLLLLLPLAAVLGWPARGYGRQRELLSLGLRILILLALVLSLAGLETGGASDRLAVVYLIDASDSMTDQAARAALDFVSLSLAGMGPNDQAAVIVFGGEALVERPMSSSRQLGPLMSIPHTGQTNLSAAIHLGIALYPPDAARRMVILSDGKITGGDPLEAARLAAESKVQIQVVPFSVNQGAESLITAVEAPNRLSERERFDLGVTTQSTQETTAAIRVLANGQVLYEGRQVLPRGEHSFSLPVSAGEPGFYRYQVQIDPVQDGFYQNNELEAYTLVEGPPRLLVISPAEQAGDGRPSTGQPGEEVQLINALKSAGMEVENLRPAELPAEIGELHPYAALVLVNVPARDLSQRQMSAVQSYVRDLGGGLVAVGGPSSYGVGGYYHTPLEETLPVEMQIKDEQRRPSATLVFIIDHSGSMSEVSGGATKLELAKEAAIRSVDLMFPNDRVGVIAFDEQASWVVPLTDLSDPGAVKNGIGSLRSGGGTDILAGLQAMASELPSDPGKVKHVILLTDGGADPTGIPELVERLRDQNAITLSTVGVGQDAAPFLAEVAGLGGGRYHFAADPGSIPSIFTEETSLATRAYLVEHPFTPQRTQTASSILSGIDAAPQLLGYVATTAKDVAETILVSDLGDPLLATWQYGLGRSAAFTSDATSRWATDWLSWEQFPDFWSQVLNSVIQVDLQQRALDLRVERSEEGGRVFISADAVTESGSTLNDYTMTARVIHPDGRPETLSLEQVAPGRYQASFEPGSTGAYWITVSGTSGDSLRSTGASSPTLDGVIETTGWVLSYSQEYRLDPSNPQLLSQVADLTGGGFALPDPGAVFQHDLTAPRASQPAWPWLLALAVLLLPIDIGLRRLVIGEAELRQAAAVLSGFVMQRRRGEATAVLRSQRMDALLRAKQRAGREDRAAPDEPAGDPHSSFTGISKTLENDSAGGSADALPSSKIDEDAIESSPENNPASLRASERLLAMKRERRKKQT